MAGSGSGDIHLAFWAAIGAVGGLVLFIRGFGMLRYKRMIQNTPASKVRSACMGLVELSGTAEGPQTIPAGITGEACFFYRAIAWKLEESGRNRQWKKVADESLYVPFFINDTTGRMLVDAAGADMEVHRNFRDEFNSSFFGSGDMLPENVGRFLARNGIFGGAAVRVEERCIKPAYPLFVFGTLAPRSLTGQTGWAPKPHVGGSSVTGMDVSWNVSRLRAPLGNGVTQLLGRVPGAERASVPAATGASRNPAPAATWSSVSIDEVSMAHSGVQTAVAEAPVEATARVGAVAQPAPQTDEETETPNSQFDVNQPAAIGKGTDGAPFMISSESQRELVKALGWKSALCIWGGPILALISMYYLLVYFELT
jgi:E3 Ubiquitin ligase